MGDQRMMPYGGGPMPNSGQNNPNLGSKVKTVTTINLIQPANQVIKTEVVYDDAQAKDSRNSFNQNNSSLNP